MHAACSSTTAPCDESRPKRVDLRLGPTIGLALAFLFSFSNPIIRPMRPQISLPPFSKVTQNHIATLGLRKEIDTARSPSPSPQISMYLVTLRKYGRACAR